ncbi:MAG: universal stress protein [Betaproteobacteria bacterium]|nr:universal stress protein [Betaproteobacteria bacterium]
MKILVPSDGSDCALRALDYAIHLVNLLGTDASITLISVHDDAGLKHVKKHFPKGTVVDFLHDLSVKELKSSRHKLDKFSLDYEVIIKTGHVAGEIVKVAKSGKFDLIVMGAKGRSTFSDLLIGSVAQRVLSATHAPVTLIK